MFGRSLANLQCDQAKTKTGGLEFPGRLFVFSLSWWGKGRPAKALKLSSEVLCDDLGVCDLSRGALLGWLKGLAFSWGVYEFYWGAALLADRT